MIQKNVRGRRDTVIFFFLTHTKTKPEELTVYPLVLMVQKCDHSGVKLEKEVGSWVP